MAKVELKQPIVQAIADDVNGAAGVVLVDYRGLNVAEDTAMRVEMRNNNVEYKVIKNRLILRALNKAGFTNFDSLLEGPTALAISYEDAVAPSKVVADNVKKTNKIVIKGGVVEGQVMDEAGIKKVAAIPAKPVLVAQLLGMLQTPVRGLAVALSEIAKKQEA